MEDYLIKNPEAGKAVPLDAKALANIILEWADRDNIGITPLKIQKIIFFCHADYLVQYSMPLVKQEFEAWEYGPVVPSVYSEFKKFKDTRITDRAYVFDPISAVRRLACSQLSGLEDRRVRALYDFYKHYSAEELSYLSHRACGAWRQARALFSNGLNMNRRISNDLIRRYHRPIHN